MSNKFIILGSGSSMGVPWADGYSGVCDLSNKYITRFKTTAIK
jgi:phosphoribosyl 1,2-cyclic phosphate phosphodiesterase